MNTISRYNYQRGVPENFAYEATTYNCENIQDALIIAHKEAQRRYNQQRREEQQREALEKYVREIVQIKLEDCLEEALSNALKKINPR